MKNFTYEARAKGLGVLTVNRPDKLNALNHTTIEELGQFLGNRDVERLNVLIITGSGEKAFVAGADIAEMNSLSASEARAFAIAGQQAFLKLERLSVVTIAAVNGYALGGGMELAMSCDLIYAAENAVFGQPEVGLGILPGFGGTQRLERYVGKLHAKELIFSGAKISASRAAELGLVNAVLPKEGFLNSVIEKANSVLANGMNAVKYCKHLIEAAGNIDLERGLQLEATTFGLVFGSAEQREGTAAFVEKRKPNFSG